MAGTYSLSLNSAALAASLTAYFSLVDDTYIENHYSYLCEQTLRKKKKHVVHITNNGNPRQPCLVIPFWVHLNDCPENTGGNPSWTRHSRHANFLTQVLPPSFPKHPDLCAYSPDPQLPVLLQVWWAKVSWGIFNQIKTQSHGMHESPGVVSASEKDLVPFPSLPDSCTSFRSFSLVIHLLVSFWLACGQGGIQVFLDQPVSGTHFTNRNIDGCLKGENFCPTNSSRHLSFMNTLDLDLNSLKAKGMVRVLACG